MQVCRIIIPLSLERLLFGKGTDMTAVGHRFVQNGVSAALGPQVFYGASDINYHLKAQQRQVEHCKSYGRKGDWIFFCSWHDNSQASYHSFECSESNSTTFAKFVGDLPFILLLPRDVTASSASLYRKVMDIWWLQTIGFPQVLQRISFQDPVWLLKNK